MNEKMFFYPNKANQNENKPAKRDVIVFSLDIFIFISLWKR